MALVSTVPDPHANPNAERELQHGVRYDIFVAIHTHDLHLLAVDNLSARRREEEPSVAAFTMLTS